MDQRPIGIFDSGLGGLTCVKKVLELLPGEDIIYFGDTGRVPYGSRSADTIIKYTTQDIRFLERFDTKLIIIACGTASSTALLQVQEAFDRRIIGVVEPACLRAARLTKNKRIGIIGTQGTIRSGKYLELLQKADPSLAVYSKACPLFVHLVENGYADSEVAYLVAKDYLQPLKDEGVDTLILGCTHYPLLTGVIRRVMGDDVQLVDAGAQAAYTAAAYLKEEGLLCNRETGTAQYYVSDAPEGFGELAGLFLNRKVEGSVRKGEIETY